MPKSITTSSFSETQSLGEEFAKQLHGGEVIALYGNLGSGKTTFVQGLAKGLGIEKKIISPTFIIMRTYEVAGKIKTFYHIDLYRIETEQDIEGLGIKELMEDKDSIMVIEWPEKIKQLLPASVINLTFSYKDEDRREIEIKENK